MKKSTPKPKVKFLVVPEFACEDALYDNFTEALEDAETYKDCTIYEVVASYTATKPKLTKNTF